MRDYRIFEHDEEVWKKSHGWGAMGILDQIFGPLNIGSRIFGELFMLTDSRSKKRQRKQPRGRVRFILPRSSVVKHGVVYSDVIRLLKKYGIRPHKGRHDAKFFYFTVRESQAQWAITVLDRWKAGTLGGSWAEKGKERKRER